MLFLFSSTDFFCFLALFHSFCFVFGSSHHLKHLGESRLIFSLLGGRCLGFFFVLYFAGWLANSHVVVRIFRDSQIVPNVVSEVIYPRSTGASGEPCRSRNLACSSYGKLRYVRSSSAFPAIGWFVVDNETATNTMTTMMTGAGSTAANDATISKRARARHERAYFNIRKLFG